MFSLSHSSKNTYLECQRKYWHQNMCKTPKDVDYITPDYFKFGRAFEQCLETFEYDFHNMLTDDIIEICHHNEIHEELHIGKMLACVRGYFASWPTTKIISMQVAFDKMLTQNINYNGRIDGLIEDEQRDMWILENKTASEISPTLDMELKHDSQLCLYVAELKQIAAICNVDPARIIGVDYRAVVKPKERLKKNEDFLTFSARCSIKSFNSKIRISSFDSDDIIANLQNVATEIDNKKTENEFLQNFRNCVQHKKYSCAYFSRCNGKCFSEANVADDSNIDF